MEKSNTPEFEYLSLICNYPDLLEKTVLNEEYFFDKDKIIFRGIYDCYKKNKAIVEQELMETEGFDIDYYVELLTKNVYTTTRYNQMKALEKIIIENYKSKKTQEIIKKYSEPLDEKKLFEELEKVKNIKITKNETIEIERMLDVLSETKTQIKLGYNSFDKVFRVEQNDFVVIAGGTGCVDKDTEYFNGKEWKKICDYQKGEKILQYDKTTGEAKLIEPIKYIKNKNNNLNLIKTKYGIDMCLSNNHTVYYLDRSDNLKSITCERMKDIHNKNKKGFSGKFITSYKYGGKGIDLSDNEIKLMLAIIADGSFSKNNTNRCYINLKKQNKINELEKILIDLKLEYRKTNKKNGYTLFSFLAPIKTKVFDEQWYNCSSHQLRVVCDNVLKWDGNNKNAFYTTIKENADFIQFAFASCDKRARILEENRIGRIRTLNGKEYKTKTIEYIVHISKNNTTSLKSQAKTKILNYKTKDGYEYCFTTDTGLWVMRRNNCICITGNCGKTSFALNLLSSMSKEYQCVYFNMEMSEKVLYKRLTSIETGIDIRRLNNFTELTTIEYTNIMQAISSISEREIILVNGKQTIESITKTLNNIDTNKPLVVIIDHIGLINSKGNGLYEKMTNVAKGIRALCFECNCTIFGLCQLSRESQKEERIPKLQDLRDSGEIEQSSRKVLLLYNKDLQKENRIKDITLYVAKDDSGGHISKDMKFDVYTQRICEVDNR